MKRTPLQRLASGYVWALFTLVFVTAMGFLPLPKKAHADMIEAGLYYTRDGNDGQCVSYCIKIGSWWKCWRVVGADSTAKP